MRRTACQAGGVPSGRVTAAARRCGAAALVCAAIWMAEPSGAVVVAQAQRAACAGDMARTPVRLHLIDRAGLSSLAREDMRREALRPWLSIGAVVAWSENLPKGPARPGGGDDLYVIAAGNVAEGDAGARQDAAAGLHPVRRRQTDDPHHDLRHGRGATPRRRAVRGWAARRFGRRIFAIVCSAARSAAPWRTSSDTFCSRRTPTPRPA